jgi:hypothetical protein
MVLNYFIRSSILLAIRCASLFTYLLASIEAAAKAVFVWSCRCILTVKCLSDYLWIVVNRFGLQQQVNFGTGRGARTVHNQLFKLQGALSFQQGLQIIYPKRRLVFVTRPATLLHSRFSETIFSS